jgi:hypothetical protein
MAWISANLTRAKKLPKLESLLSKKEKDNSDMESRMKSMLMGIGKSG